MRGSWRVPPELKEQVVAEYLEGGHTQKIIARARGISVGTLQEALREYKRGRLTELERAAQKHDAAVTHVLERLQGGERLRAICRDLDLSYEAMLPRVKAAGGGQYLRRTKRDIPDDIKRACATEYDAGESAYSVAKRYGVGHTSVIRWWTTGVDA